MGLKTGRLVESCLWDIHSQNPSPLSHSYGTAPVKSKQNTRGLFPKNSKVEIPWGCGIYIIVECEATLLKLGWLIHGSHQWLLRPAFFLRFAGSQVYNVRQETRKSEDSEQPKKRKTKTKPKDTDIYSSPMKETNQITHRIHKRHLHRHKTSVNPSELWSESQWQETFEETKYETQRPK